MLRSILVVMSLGLVVSCDDAGVVEERSLPNIGVSCWHQFDVDGCCASKGQSTYCCVLPKDAKLDCFKALPPKKADVITEALLDFMAGFETGDVETTG